MERITAKEARSWKDVKNIIKFTKDIDKYYDLYISDIKRAAVKGHEFASVYRFEPYGVSDYVFDILRADGFKIEKDIDKGYEHHIISWRK